MEQQRLASQGRGGLSTDGEIFPEGAIFPGERDRAHTYCLAEPSDRYSEPLQSQSALMRNAESRKGGPLGNSSCRHSDYGTVVEIESSSQQLLRPVDVPSYAAVVEIDSDEDSATEERKLESIQEFEDTQSLSLTSDDFSFTSRLPGSARELA